jgi:long-subunit fatty acid transport protein
MPSDAVLSANGVGIGAAAGILIRPNPHWAVGVGWRSDLDIPTSGSGTAQLGTGAKQVDVTHPQNWPQSTSLAIAYKPGAMEISAQLDWTQWSHLEGLDIHTSLPLDQHFNLDWSDSITARLGAQWASGKLAVRGGVLFDQNAVPDLTIQRQYLDGNKFGGALGGSYQLGKKMWLDVAADAVAGPVRKVPDNSADTTNFPALTNAAPGDHSGQVYTFAAGMRFGL